MNDASYLLDSIFVHTGSLTHFREHVNIKKKSPFDMLGLSKYEYDILVRMLNLDFQNINFFARNKKFFPLGDYLSYENSYSTLDFELLEKHQYGFLKPLNYISKQEEKLQQPLFISTLTDYWDMMTILNVSNFNPYPQDILKAHDKASKAIMLLRNNSKLIRYKQRAKALEKYKFEYKDLIIFPCSSDAELYNEGEALEHCVYGYADKYIDGQTALFFIRYKDKPNIPFYTLEFDESNCKIRQNHGWKNELCNEKDKGVIEFEKEWLKFAKQVKEKRNGKQRNRSKKSKSAYSA